MQKLDLMNVKGLRRRDDKVIIRAHINGDILLVDERGRVYNEYWLYVADVVFTVPGYGLGCERLKNYRDFISGPRPFKREKKIISD